MKTREEVWYPLEHEGRLLAPEAEQRMRRVLNLLCVAPTSKGSPWDLGVWYGKRRVREARIAAKLPADVTLDACRRGGIEEADSSGMPEPHKVGLTGHKTPEAARLYVPLAERQRIAAANMRRDLVEGKLLPARRKKRQRSANSVRE